MKFLTLLILVSSFSAMASTSGTFKGQCILTNKNSSRTLSFGVRDNQKAITSLNEDLRVTIVNNLGNSDALYFSALAISVEAHYGGVFHNPPLLCPTKPLAAKLECEAENERNAPKYVEAPWEKFLVVANNGEGRVLSQTNIVLQDLRDGQKVSFQTSIKDSSVECDGVFVEN